MSKSTVICVPSISSRALIVIPIRAYSLRRQIVQGEKKDAANEEKAPPTEVVVAAGDAPVPSVAATLTEKDLESGLRDGPEIKEKSPDVGTSTRTEEVRTGS